MVEQLNTARGSLVEQLEYKQQELSLEDLDNPGDCLQITEQYDGTSWTEVNDLNTAR